VFSKTDGVAMMNILEQIISAKRVEVEKRKQLFSVSELEKNRFFSAKTRSLVKSVLHPQKTGIIAEYKRRSPSKGVINERHSVEAVTRAYAGYGASGISILTDYQFFGGSLDDLVSAQDNGVPLLRKDFIIDEYQLIEAKAFGADVILLIAACLKPAEVKSLAKTAHELGLEVLLELHGEEELDHLCTETDLVGVNNRNLKTFEVNLDHSIKLCDRIGPSFTRIAESGIRSVQDVRLLKSHGFDGFLIGEYFMKQESPMAAFKEFTYAL
jgi:indole-3-glycerol phosphate synthase